MKRRGDVEATQPSQLDDVAAVEERQKQMKCKANCIFMEMAV